jgi:hypothetical protein
MPCTVLVRAADAQPVESKTPGKKQVTIVKPEVSTRRVDKFKHMNAVRDSRGVFDKDNKLILLILATHARQDGSEVRPGLPLLADETGISQATLKRRIPNLVRMGYLLQLTSGKGGNSKKASVYALAMPVEIKTEVEAKGSPDEPLAIGANSSSENPNSSNPGVPMAHPDELTTSQGTSQENIPSSARDDGGCPSGEDRGGQAPHTPEGPGGISSDEGLAVEWQPFWSGDSEHAQEWRKILAEAFGVPIGASLWRWLDDIDRELWHAAYDTCEHDCECEHDPLYNALPGAVDDAAVVAVKKARSPEGRVGYFKAILPGSLDQHRAAGHVS